jgi:DNA polymerase bacteriophage-type
LSALTLPRVLCDFETYSEADLKKVGAYIYAKHPSTEILCLAYKLPNKPTRLWRAWKKEPFPRELEEFIANGGVLEAHNAAFERWVWKFQLTAKLNIPMPKRFIDTMASCAYRSLPMKLDDVGAVLRLDVQKDKEGKALLQKLSKPRKPTKKDPSRRCLDPDLLERLGQYCIQDVDAEYALYRAIGDLPLDEYMVWVLDQKINARGITIDLDAVESAMAVVDEATERLLKKLNEITKGKVQTGKQVDRLIEWCDANGWSMENMRANVVADALTEEHLPDEVREVLQIRQALSKASTSKLIRFLDCTDREDNKVRGLLQYHGASTGRWAGRLVQPQNFPRGSVKSRMDTMISAIKTRDVDFIEMMFSTPAVNVVASSLRGMIVSTPGRKLYVADFSAIEARVVMWLAQQEDAVEAFRAYDRKEGPDIYCFMASKIYQRPINKDEDPDERQLGKITILGCGYQMSGSKLKIQAGQAYGIELEDDTANMLVRTFRESYPEVVNLWRGLEDAAIRAVQRKTETRYLTIGFRYVEDDAGTWLTMILPNGRCLWYRSPGLQEVIIPYKDKETGEDKTFTKDALFYYGKDAKKQGRWGKVFTYGGMLTENAVQAIARDIMVAAMRRVEKAGFETVLSVHDELICELDDDGNDQLSAFVEHMKGPNEGWFKSCPVSAEGWSGYRYRK